MHETKWEATGSSKTTLKIQHEVLQREVEQAIRKANTNEDNSINFEEFKNTLLYLHYIPDLYSNKQSFDRNSSPSVRESLVNSSEEDKALLNTLWIYLNPLAKEEVEKAATFDFLLLLIFNISRLSESEMVEIFAKHLLEYYTTSFGIEMEWKFEYPDTQVVNSFMVENINTWSIKKLVQAFKKDHVRRYGYFDKSRSLTSMPALEPSLMKNKSFQNMIPVDHRHYHGETYENLAKNYTFTPKIN